MKTSNKMLSIIFFSKTFSHYDSAVWIRFLEAKKYLFKIYFSDNPLGINKPQDYEKFINKYNGRLVKNNGFWILKKHLIWQSKVISECLFQKLDIVIFNGEMNCLTNWIGSIICRFRKIKVIHWGHGFYGNEIFFKLFLRKIFYRLADIHLVYGKRSRELFYENNFDISKVHVIYNSINNNKLVKSKLSPKFKYEMFRKSNLPVILFIGRLTKQKEIDLLINSINEINNKSTLLNLLIIGDGSERNKLEEISKKGIHKKEIFFYGSEHDEIKLSNLIFNATLCVSPGEVGLTSIHCLSHGLAVASHDDLNNQMPEAEVIKNGYNGFLFKKQSKKDLKEKMINWVSMTNKQEIRKNCLKSIINYTPQNQFKIFENIIYKNIE